MPWPFISFAISLAAFLLAALKVKVGDLLLVDWGLVFLALGFVLSCFYAPYYTRARGPV